MVCSSAAWAESMGGSTGCSISSTQVDVVGQLYSCNHHHDQKKHSVKGGGGTEDLWLILLLRAGIIIKYYPSKM